MKHYNYSCYYPLLATAVVVIIQQHRIYVHGLSLSPLSRRDLIVNSVLATTTSVVMPSSSLSSSAAAEIRAPAATTSATVDEEKEQQQQQQRQEQAVERPFVSAAYTKREYTNSIVASRDTNISPAEVYDTIRSRLQLQQEQQQLEADGKSDSSNNNLRALDVGAGAGVSTQVIYDELGIKTIDAVDWSGDAWKLNVVDDQDGHCPNSVKFYEMDDERFIETIWKTKLNQPKYDIIAFNFAVNRDKAMYFCKSLLKSNTGLLLAPINTQTDYWLKQTYVLLDSSGSIVWSANDVGAWSVQFQPDVTQDTCQGIWCAPYNGFQKYRKL